MGLCRVRATASGVPTPLLSNKRGRRRQGGSPGKEMQSQLEIASRSPAQIEAKVTLLYGDERRSQAGQLIEQTPQAERRNTYVFGRNQKLWKLERVIFQAN